MCSLCALGAVARDLLGVVAVVAQHAPVAPVIGQRDRAVDALHALAAGAAGDEAGKSAPVEQQHGLLAVFQALPSPLHQRARKGGLLARLQKLLRACRSARTCGMGRASMRPGSSSSVYLPRSAL